MPGTFPVASKILHKYEQDRAYRLHRQKVSTSIHKKVMNVHSTILLVWHVWYGFSLETISNQTKSHQLNYYKQLTWLRHMKY